MSLPYLRVRPSGSPIVSNAQQRLIRANLRHFPAIARGSGKFFSPVLSDSYIDLQRCQRLTITNFGRFCG
jgi:hypothetical protein